MLSLKHPTYYDPDYMDGYITLGGAGVVPMTRTVTADTLDPNGNFFELFPNAPPDTADYESTLDMILYNLLLSETSLTRR